MEQNIQDKRIISYGDLSNLSVALTTAVTGQLMSLEEARFIWKRHLVSVGWKKPTVTLTDVEQPEKVETITQKIKGKIITKAI